MSRVAIVLAVLALAGCSHFSFEDEEAARVGPDAFCTPDVDRLPCRAAVQKGKPYRFQIYTHCGLGWSVYFDGRYWFVQDSRDESGWGGSTVRGTMTLEADDAAVFRSDAGKGAVFEPAPRSYRPPGCA
jgi:hypothetical protein